MRLGVLRSLWTSGVRSESSVLKAWATSLIKTGNKGAAGASGEDQGHLRRTPLSPSVQGEGESPTVETRRKPRVYRRRLTDMSWTTEPMDEKLIWVDCEMTGLDYNKEIIIEIGAVITDPDLNEIARQDSIILNAPEQLLNEMSAWCLKHHGDSGLIESCKTSSVTSDQADQVLHDFVTKHTKQGECPMAGNSIYMDRIFIAKQFPKFHSHFHYRNVDVSTIKELVRRWYPDDYFAAPKKKFSHRVLDDIADSIAELKYYRESVFKQRSSVSRDSQSGKEQKLNR